MVQAVWRQDPVPPVRTDAPGPDTPDSLPGVPCPGHLEQRRDEEALWRNCVEDFEEKSGGFQDLGKYLSLMPVREL